MTEPPRPTPETDTAEREFQQWRNILRDRDPQVRKSAGEHPVPDGWDFSRDLEQQRDAALERVRTLEEGIREHRGARAALGERISPIDGKLWLILDPEC